ncbi:hypothetical protein Noda2021_12230 [Candidatus Dependentiae bacterium Noda2021]|nr:hypothetical protein Noda2021_12230 [Candidatus Dependentiae bacterium Noda2021]
MKLRLQLATLGLLSLLAVPAATHTMAGRMVGTFVGTGGALASYWAYQNTDRLGSVFTRTDRLLASAVDKPAESAAQAITNATSGQTLSQLGGAIGKQAEQLTSAISTIASSKMLTAALIAGVGI